LFGGDAERGHEAVGFLDACLRALALREDDFQLEEMPQVLDTIEVDARSSNEVQGAMLADAPCLTVGERERLAERIRRRRGRDDEEGLLRTRLVRALIEDELTGVGGEPAQLQSSALACEERIVLHDLHRAVMRQGRDRGRDGIHARKTRFDLDVTSHVT
jgi:hypothetical protein